LGGCNVFRHHPPLGNVVDARAFRKGNMALSTLFLHNDPTRAGQTAAPKRLFGEWRRYTVAPIHTRFDAAEWFVWDAHTDDGSGRPAVIRQASTEAEAVAGL
jgi:hypothetical protein